VRRILFLLSFSVVLLLSFSKIVQAQCGASLSSCKTCHEVKRAKPVSNQGPWHQQHAFGDFCEFCHGGNTAAKDEAGAHQGINTMPLKNAGNTCSSCHPDDFKERALKYAAVLKINLDNLETSESGQGGPAQTSQGSQESVSAPTSGSTIAIPSGGEVVDFNVLLHEKEEHKINMGNIILILLILGTFFIFLLLYWMFNKHKITEKIKAFLREVREPAAATEVREEEVTTPDWNKVTTILERRPIIQNLVLQLNEFDHATLEALIKITSDEEGERIIKSLARLDLNLIASLTKLSERELEMTTTLAKRL